MYAVSIRKGAETTKEQAEIREHTLAALYAYWRPTRARFRSVNIYLITGLLRSACSHFKMTPHFTVRGLQRNVCVLMGRGRSDERERVEGPWVCQWVSEARGARDVREADA